MGRSSGWQRTADPQRTQNVNRRRWFLSTASGRLVLVVLVLKAAVLVFNAATYPSKRQYDASHHAWRARSAGLEMGKMAYNSPLYYLPLLPWVDLRRFYEDGRPVVDERYEDGPPLLRSKRARVEAAKDLRRLDLLKGLNVGYVLGAYLVWIYGLFPVLLNRERWLWASLLLLALPGFQKAAVMAHPDVLLIFLASLTFYLTLRWMSEPARPWRSVVLAVLAGLTGACRPFALVPMLVCWGVNVTMLCRAAWQELRAGGTDAARIVTRSVGQVVLVTSIVGALSAGWWGYRYAQTGEVLNAYDDRYLAPFQPLKPKLDRVHYYASFHLRSLLETPSRADGGRKPSLAADTNNSFWTLLYSELWGDHYLVYSGPKHHVESKLWVKRVLFVVALPLSILWLFGMLAGTFRACSLALRDRNPLRPELLVAAVCWGGWLLFVYWQGTAGLLPGKNSTIKFLYVAWLVPFGIALAASPKTPRAPMHAVAANVVALLLSAFAMSMHWPSQ